MATTKTSNLTDAQAGTGKNVPNRVSRGVMVEGKDIHAYTTGELDAADILLTNIKLPSNAVVTELLVRNDDLDSDGTPTLSVDIGYAAAQPFKSKTSGVETKHALNAILDADALIDGSSALQSSNNKYTSISFDSATRGPSQSHEACWETLGYDEDPKTDFLVAVTVATGAATAAAGSLALLVRYTIDG